MNPRTVNILFNGYFAGAGAYIVGNAYLDSKRMVEKWRNNQLDDYDKRRYKTELEAARSGMFDNIPMHLMGAFLWPVFAPIMAIPHIVTNNKKE
jgi:hypothetical protein